MTPNTVVQRRDIASTVLKIMPPVSRPLQHGVRKDSLHLPRFYSRIQVQFLFLSDTAFCSFTLCFLSLFLFSPNHFLVRRFIIFYFSELLYCLFFHDTLLLAAFKMGVKSVRTVTIFSYSPRCPSFVASRYFRGSTNQARLPKMRKSSPLELFHR